MAVYGSHADYGDSDYYKDDWLTIYGSNYAYGESPLYKDEANDPLGGPQTYIVSGTISVDLMITI